MPIKHLRHESEIGEYAEDLARRWKQGDGVEPFLRRLEPEFSKRVHDDFWSWNAVARALNLAGIAYQTGRPWTGLTLAQKVQSIRYKAKKKAGRPGASLAGSPAHPSPSASVPANKPLTPLTAPPSALTDDPAAEQEPEFKPARLVGWSGQASVQKPSHPAPEATAASPSTGNAEAKIARLLGKR